MARYFALSIGCTLLALIPASAQQPAAGDKTAVSVVRRAVAGHGGLEAWNGFQDVVWRETIERFEKDRVVETTVRIIYVQKKDGRMRIRIEQDNGSIEHLDEQLEVDSSPVKGFTVIGHDGHQSWYAVDGVLDTTPRAARSAQYVTVAFMYFFGLPFKLLDPGANLTLLPSVTRYGKRHDVVQVSFERGVGDNPTDGFVYYFGQASGRITDIRYWRVGHRNRQRLGQWRDYVKVGDLWKESLRIFQSADGMVKSTERRFEYLRVNSGLDDGLFSPQSAAKRGPVR